MNMKFFGTNGRIRVPRAYPPDQNGGDGLIVVEKTRCYTNGNYK